MSAGVVAALALYPLLVYFGLRHFGAVWAAALLAAICALRLAVLRLRGAAPGTAAQAWLLCGAIGLALIGMLSRSSDAIRYYPVLMNAGLLLAFGLSLAHPPTVVERIARLQTPDLPPEGVRYTRRVTVAWVVFFVCNGTAALYTALYSSFETWALYNGAVAYALIAAMFGGELITRRLLKKRLRA
jgi:uncharacterized membrane protein